MGWRGSSGGGLRRVRKVENLNVHGLTEMAPSKVTWVAVHLKVLLVVTREFKTLHVTFGSCYDTLDWNLSAAIA